MSRICKPRHLVLIHLYPMPPEGLMVKTSQRVQRAFDLRFGKVGNVCIDLCGLKGTVPQQILNETDIGAGFQQMRSKAMAQTMYTYFLLYSGFLQSFFKNRLYRPRSIRIARLPFKKVYFGPVLQVIVPDIG